MHNPCLMQILEIFSFLCGTLFVLVFYVVFFVSLFWDIVFTLLFNHLQQTNFLQGDCNEKQTL